MRLSVRLIPLFTLFLPTLSAQESGFDLIPETAAAVVRIQAPEQITADLVEFINKVQPGFGGLAEAQLPMAFGQAIKNPQLAGVDQSKDWYVALFVDESGRTQRSTRTASDGRGRSQRSDGGDFRVCRTQDLADLFSGRSIP